MTAAFSLPLATDCIRSYFILIQYFPVWLMLPLHFSAIWDFLLLSRVGNGLHCPCVQSQRLFCLVTKDTIISKECKKDQVPGQSVFEMRFIVMALKRAQDNPVDPKTQLASDGSSANRSSIPLDDHHPVTDSAPLSNSFTEEALCSLYLPFHLCFICLHNLQLCMQG